MSYEQTMLEGGLSHAQGNISFPRGHLIISSERATNLLAFATRLGPVATGGV